MILTCPKCANRYHVSRSLTEDFLAFCPICSHEWVAAGALRHQKTEEEAKIVDTPQNLWIEKIKLHKVRLGIIFVMFSSVLYILNPLVKSGFESLQKLLSHQKPVVGNLKIEHVNHHYDEQEKKVYIYWSLKNEGDVSENLKNFRIQVFGTCQKGGGHCINKELKYKPHQDVILPKETLRFEMEEKTIVPPIKVEIFY